MDMNRGYELVETLNKRIKKYENARSKERKSEDCDIEYVIELTARINELVFCRKAIINKFRLTFAE